MATNPIEDCLQATIDDFESAVTIAELTYAKGQRIDYETPSVTDGITTIGDEVLMHFAVSYFGSARSIQKSCATNLEKVRESETSV